MKLVEFASITDGKPKADRIRREDVPGTVKFIGELLSIPRNELHPLGSVGKIADSNDIDLGVDINKFHPEHIDKIMKAHNFSGSYDKNQRVGTYVVPVKGDPANGYVKVDLMFTTNTDWAQFSYHSAGEGSRYKGAVRTVLLASTASILNEPGTDHFVYRPDGQLVVRVGRTVDLASGLRRIFQYRPKKAAGEGYSKSMKSLSPEEFKSMHPDVQIKNGNMLIDDPEKVVKVLFGKGVAPEDVGSAEQILHLIKTKFTPEQQKKIFKLARLRLKDMKGIRIPPELEETPQ